jgi:hypothetical protein
MPLLRYHVFTMGSTGEAVTATAGGGAFYLRRKRWSLMFLLLALVLL